MAVPLDLSSGLEPTVQGSDERAIPWFPFWGTSYMLTNAIYRVAAAAEKICYLTGPELREDRRVLSKAALTPDSELSRRLPKAYELLGQMPSRKDRRAHLLAQRTTFPDSQSIALPLVCAFIQTDIDKHVASRPLKELAFDVTLAAESFREACDLWDAAVETECRAG